MLLQHTDISDIPSVRNVSTATIKNALPKDQLWPYPAFFLASFFESSHASWAKDTKQNVTIEVDGIFQILWSVWEPIAGYPESQQRDERSCFVSAPCLI